MSGDLPEIPLWHDYNPATGVGDPSTPLQASTLNAWRTAVNARTSEAVTRSEAAAAEAEAVVDRVTDELVAAVMEDPGSQTRAIADAIYARPTSGAGTSAATEIAGAAAASARIGGVYRAAWMTTPGEVGFAPDASNVYGALWTRDHAYTIWHMPNLLTADQIADFVRYRLATRSTSSTPDPDGGTLGAAGANFVADRITAAGSVVFKNPGMSKYPFMDGIAFTVLALWVHWTRTGSRALLDEVRLQVNACLAALPRSSSGCVWSDPAAPSIDYGFTDTVKKTGDVAYGTALLAWALKMLAEVDGEAGDGPYTEARAVAEAGLATLRKPSGWYAGSSGNNASVDDVWATALIAAEGLCPPEDAEVSGRALRDAYLAGTITRRGWVRHLPGSQTWAGTTTTVGTYQNGAWWITPLWDCYRAVRLVDPVTADAWAAEAVAEVLRQYAAEGTVGVRTAPYEWFNASTISTPKGYTPSAALVARFTSKPTRAYQAVPTATSSALVDLSVSPSDWTLTGFTWNSTDRTLVSAGAVDGETAIRNGSLADAGVSALVRFSSVGNTFPALVLRYADANNYIFAGIGGATNHQIIIYDRIGGTTTARATVALPAGTAAGVWYPLSVSVIGTTVKLRLGNTVATGATSITAAGRVGLRHGRAGAGTTAYRQIRVASLAAAGTGVSTLPADVILAHEGGVLGPGDEVTGPLSGQYRALAPSGAPVLMGSAGAGPVVITGPLD